MAKVAEVTKIVLEIDGKEIELTPKDAKSLYLALKELVGEKETVVIPSPYPVYPYTIPWRYEHPYRYCITGDNVTYGTGRGGVTTTWTNTNASNSL